MSRAVYIVSYPGSGRTWLGLMVGKAIDLHFGLELTSGKALLEGRFWLNPKVNMPEFHFVHADRPYLKAISKYRPQPEPKYRDAEIVFLARDPRDIIVSMFFKFSRRWEVIKVRRFTGTLSEFMRHEKYGIEGIVAYYNLWADAWTWQIHYEDMRENPNQELAWMLRQLGMTASPETLDEAVQFASFDNMWKLESTNFNAWLRETKKGDPESRRVRRGKVGGYVDYMTPDDIAFANEAMRGLDPYYGYGI